MQFELDQNDLNVIGAGLGKLPMEMALQTFNKINKQIAEQQAPEVKPKAPAVKPKAPAIKPNAKAVKAKSEGK